MPTASVPSTPHAPAKAARLPRHRLQPAPPRPATHPSQRQPTPERGALRTPSHRAGSADLRKVRSRAGRKFSYPRSPGPQSRTRCPG